MYLFLVKQTSPTQAVLSGQEAHHCLKVLRHQAGDAIHAIDGEGNYLKGTLLAVQKDVAVMEIAESQAHWGEPPIQITLAVSPLKDKDRFEWLLEKAVELGVSRIQPVVCRHTIRYTENLKTERLESIILSATKQCKRARIPALEPIMPLAQYLKEEQSPVRLMGWCESDLPAKTALDTIEKHLQMAWLIGPEGDFSAEEVNLAAQNNWNAVSLGSSRLRTETAGMYALAWTKAQIGY